MCLHWPLSCQVTNWNSPHSRSEVLLLIVRQGFLCDLVRIKSAGKMKPCCRKGNGKMLLGSLQEVWVTCCVRATQRKHGKSSRWPADALIMSGSHNNRTVIVLKETAWYTGEADSKKGISTMCQPLYWKRIWKWSTKGTLWIASASYCIC